MRFWKAASKVEEADKKKRLADGKKHVEDREAFIAAAFADQDISEENFRSGLGQFFGGDRGKLEAELARLETIQDLRIELGREPAVNARRREVRAELDRAVAEFEATRKAHFAKLESLKAASVSLANETEKFPKLRSRLLELDPVAAADHESLVTEKRALFNLMNRLNIEIEKTERVVAESRADLHTHRRNSEPDVDRIGKLEKRLSESAERLDSLKAEKADLVAKRSAVQQQIARSI